MSASSVTATLALAHLAPPVDVGLGRAARLFFRHVAHDCVQVHVVAVELSQLGRHARGLLRLYGFFQTLQRIRVLVHQAVGLRHVRFSEPLFLHPAPVALIARLTIIPFGIRHTFVAASAHSTLGVGFARRLSGRAAAFAIARDFLAFATLLLVPRLRILRRPVFFLALILLLALLFGARLRLLLRLAVPADVRAASSSVRVRGGRRRASLRDRSRAAACHRCRDRSQRDRHPRRSQLGSSSGMNRSSMLPSARAVRSAPSTVVSARSK